MALICNMCDMPATRKVCGFAGHSACHGCAKCLKQFPSDVFPNKLDYSGYIYDRDTWEHYHLWEQGTVIRMSRSTLELTEAASIFSEVDMLIISFGVHSQVGQALGNYAWRWVPHPHMYTTTLWEHGTVIRMS